MKRLLTPIFIIVIGLFMACSASGQKKKAENEGGIEAIKKRVLTEVVDADTISVGHVEKTAKEWKAVLTDAEYHILRERGTEPAFKNEYYDNKTEGIYYCAACGLPLFTSKTKFHSGTGWPSFWAPIDSKLVERKIDKRFGMKRVEVVCAQCGSHLGHIFPNNTVPSGERHCLNSLALDFKAQEI